MKSLTIGWLYPELMNIYGDRGNITTLVKRCEWREIKTEVKYLNHGFSDNDLKSCDFLLMGGAQDRQQSIVNTDFKKHHKSLSEMIDNGTPGLYVCGGFQFLGNYYKDSDGTIIDGLGIFDLNTQNPGAEVERLIGNIVIRPNIGDLDKQIVGFENHGGRTILGPNIEPFGTVLKGFGNNKDGSEGAKYKNSFGTYMHGPILPKNPHFADYLIKVALNVDKLSPLDDKLEWQAHDSITKKLELL